MTVFLFSEAVKLGSPIPLMKPSSVLSTGAIVGWLPGFPPSPAKGFFVSFFSLHLFLFYWDLDPMMAFHLLHASLHSYWIPTLTAFSQGREDLCRLPLYTFDPIRLGMLQKNNPKWTLSPTMVGLWLQLWLC